MFIYTEGVAAVASAAAQMRHLGTLAEMRDAGVDIEAQFGHATRICAKAKT